MKLEYNKTKLEEVFAKAVRLSGKHLTLPVLSCIYLNLEGNNLTIKSTNLDLGLEMNLEIKNGSSGTVAVPGGILLSTLSSMHETQVTLETEEGNLRLRAGNNSALIKCLPHEDFPSIPRITGLNTIKIGATDLVVGLKSVWYSASNSGVKPELASVYVYQSDDSLIFVSTDSFRLAEKRVHAKNITDFPTTLIPQKNVAEMIKLLEDYKGEVEISFDKNQASFATPEIYLVSRLIDGSFPDYKQIIPKEPVSKITLLKSDLQNAIKVSNIFSDALNQIRFKVNPKHKSLDIESKNNDVGEYKESIKANVEGEALELNFNNRYVAECFQSIPSESLVLEFAGPSKPLVIRGASDKSFTYIVMPMNR